MARGKTNIDIIFRDGLKNIEVLPPAGVWDDVGGRLVHTSRMRFISTVAAAVLFLGTVSAVTYSLTRIIKSSGLAPELNAGLLNYISQDPQSDYRSYYPNPVIKEREKRFPTPKSRIIVNETDDERESPDLYGNLFADVSPGSVNSRSLAETDDYSLQLKRQSFSYQTVPEHVGLKEKRENKINRWSVGAQMSPSYFMNNGNVGVDLSANAKILEEAMMAYAGGVAFSYHINNRLSIQSGISYSAVGHSIGGISVFSGFFFHAGTKSGTLFDVATSNGTIVTSNKDIYLLDFSGDRVASSFASETFDPYKADLEFIGNNLYQSFKYLEFPVMLRYKVIDKKLDMNLIGGLAYNFLIGNDAFTYADGNKVDLGVTEGLTPLTFSSSLGVGMEYAFSGNLTLNIEPIFRYYVNPFGTISGNWENPYSFGLFSGLFYKF